MHNGAIGFFLFFVILIIIWIFAMGGCVRERNSLGVYEGMTNQECLANQSHCITKCIKEYNGYNQQCFSNCENNWKCKPAKGAKGNAGEISPKIIPGSIEIPSYGVFFESE